MKRWLGQGMTEEPYQALAAVREDSDLGHKDTAGDGPLPSDASGKPGRSTGA